MIRCCLAITAICIAGSAFAAQERDPLAEVFGTLPSMWGVRISPDGSKVSFLQMHPNDMPVALVADPVKGEINLALASVKDEFDLRWCEWASDERLLCGFEGISSEGLGHLYALTRLVAVDADGRNMKVLLQNELRGQWAQFQDKIVDYLVDDPRHVLVAMPGEGGHGLSRLDIHTGRTRTVTRARSGVFDWLSDGRGTARCRFSMTQRKSRWSCRAGADDDWTLVDESRVGTSVYEPVGFGEDPDRLLVLKPHGSRMALWAEDLKDGGRAKLVYAHPDVDVGGPVYLGKHRRIVAVHYSTDRPDMYFFDDDVERVVRAMNEVFPGKSVSVLGESWDRRHYLFHVGSDTDSGSFQTLDVAKGHLLRLASTHPGLDGRTLAPMQPMEYPTRDGASVPGYLTLPPGGPKSGLPAVLLPHGGPSARDEWGFDPIVQFLASRGYAVLQGNYRGSAGYGGEWLGEGAFRSWRRAIEDVTDGASHLVESGVADPERICIVGWSYGGYAALLSAVEEPSRYKCAVAIAPVTDPWLWIRERRKFIGGRASMEDFVGLEDEVLEKGSPLVRAAEIEAPVLLFHGDEDLNVGVEHSRRMQSALSRAKKSVDYVEYPEVEHQIRRNRYRIDMLTRIGAFLDEHIGAPRASASAPDGAVRE